MYKCHDCDLIFDEPKKYVEDRTPYGGYPEPGFSEEFLGCPSCSNDYDEVMLCQRCNDTYVSVEVGYPFCAGCVHDLIQEYKKLMVDNFREDEFDVIYDHMDYIEPYKKGE